MAQSLVPISISSVAGSPSLLGALSTKGSILGAPRANGVLNGPSCGLNQLIPHSLGSSLSSSQSVGSQSIVSHLVFLSTSSGFSTSSKNTNNGSSSLASSSIVTSLISSSLAQGEAIDQCGLAEQHDKVVQNGRNNAVLSQTYGTKSSMSWGQLVGGSSAAKPHTQKHKLSYIKPSLIDGVPHVFPPPEVAKEGAQIWTNCLVGHFIVTRRPFSIVNNIARKIWAKEGLLEVLTQHHDFLIFRFSSEQGLASVSTEVHGYLQADIFFC